MNKNRTITLLVLFAVLAAAAPLAAGETGPEIGRVWAEPGEQVGLRNQFTQTVEVRDALGSPAKTAEDWQIVDDIVFGGLFTYHQQKEGGFFTVRAAGDNGGESGGGWIGMQAGKTGDWAVAAAYKGFDHYYDRSTEDPYPMEVPPAELDILPTMRRNQAVVEMKKYLGGPYALRMNAGYEYVSQDGEKALLTRSGGLPVIEQRTTDFLRFWLAGSGSAGKLAADWSGDLQVQDGDRDRGAPGIYDEHRFDIDATDWSVRVGARYDASPRLRLLASGGTYNRSGEPYDVDGETIFRLDNEISSQTGVLGLIWRATPDLNVKLSGRFQNRDTDAAADGGSDAGDNSVTDIEQTSRQYRLDLNYSGLDRTKLYASYRYGSREKDEVLAVRDLADLGAAVVSQVTDQQKNSGEFVFKGRTRLSRKASVRLRATYRSEDIEETVTGDQLRYWQGDRSENRFRGRASLALVPARDVRLDAGYEMIRQTFERDDVEDVETTWDSDRVYATASWLANDRITVLGSFSMGKEDYAIDGYDGALPAEYEGTTYRFSPGVVMRPMDDVSVEGHYEGVRQRDSVDGDYDRWYFRANWRSTEKTCLTASYRRYEFDENRWDDTITDLYALSFTQRF